MPILYNVSFLYSLYTFILQCLYRVRARMKLVAPQLPPSWEHNQESIAALVKEAMENHRVVLDNIGKLEPENCDFESVRITKLIQSASCR